MAAALQATSVDMDTPEGLHLRQVVDEYSCIHAIAARVDPAHHMALVANAVNAYAGNSSAPNYREAVVMLLNACNGSHVCWSLLRSLCIMSAASSEVDSISVSSARRMDCIQASCCTGAFTSGCIYCLTTDSYALPALQKKFCA